MPEQTSFSSFAEEPLPRDAHETFQWGQRVLCLAGVLLYVPFALFIAFIHFSRVDPAPKFSPLAALLAGPFGLTSFRGMSGVTLLVLIGLTLVSVSYAIFTRYRERRRFALVLGFVVWLLSAIAVANGGHFG